MLKERLYFLKYDFLISLFAIFTLLLASLFANFSINVFFWIGGIFLIMQINGFWSIRYGCLGKSLVTLTISIFLFIAFAERVILKPLSPEQIGTYVGIEFPFNYIILALYFLTIIWVFIKVFQNREKRTCIQKENNWDIDYTKGIAYLYPISGEKSSIKIDPKKHTISVWLTVITQVFLVKMSWNSTGAGIFTLVCLSFIAPIVLFCAVTLFCEFLGMVSIERAKGIHLKPALRKPFKLWKTLKESQKNSY